MMRRLMAVLAHPGDESLGVGGRLARYTAEGVTTALVTATRGDRGRFGDARPVTLGTPAWRLSAMLVNCRVLHLADPHFGPENARHRRVLEALMQLLAAQGLVPELIRVHCSEKSTLPFFEDEATRMADRLAEGLTVEFVRWRERNGGERLHNRYGLTDLGGVALGVGLDAGGQGQTDDFLLLPRAIYNRRWSQYVDNDGAFEQADLPTPVRGTRRMRVR